MAKGTKFWEKKARVRKAIIPVNATDFVNSVIRETHRSDTWTNDTDLSKLNYDTPAKDALAARINARMTDGASKAVQDLEVVIRVPATTTSSVRLG